ncbi:MAG: invasion associated locus B family protein [Alphaproteobacteria bacterium]
MKKIISFAFIGLICVVNTAHSRQSLGTYGDWTAYKMEENGEKVCYMASVPQKKEGNYKKRGEVFLIIAHRPAKKTFNTVSLTAGYDYKKNSPVFVQIDKKPEIELFTDRDTAWATDEQDKQLVSMMRSGSKAVFKGTSSRGTLTTDTFSLKGFTKAANAIDKACGKK